MSTSSDHSSARATTRKGHCPKCADERVSDVVALHEAPWEDREQGIWGEQNYFVLRCRGCETVYFQREELFSEDLELGVDPQTGEYDERLRPSISHWPLPVPRPKPEWLWKIGDAELRNVLEEAYAAANADLRVLATIGTRTALDRAFVVNGAVETDPFVQKITALQQTGIISQEEEELLNTCTDAGSAAAHRSWRPTPEMLTALLDGVEAFLYRVFVSEQRTLRLEEENPAEETEGQDLEVIPTSDPQRTQASRCLDLLSADAPSVVSP